MKDRFLSRLIKNFCKRRRTDLTDRLGDYQKNRFGRSSLRGGNDTLNPVEGETNPVHFLRRFQMKRGNEIITEKSTDNVYRIRERNATKVENIFRPDKQMDANLCRNHNKSK